MNEKNIKELYKIINRDVKSPSKTKGVRKEKKERYPGFHLVKNPDGTDTSRLLDSIWISDDGEELKVVFATGQVVTHKPSPTN